MIAGDQTEVRATTIIDYHDNNFKLVKFCMIIVDGFSHLISLN